MKQFLKNGVVDGLNEELQTIVELIRNNKGKSAQEHLEDYLHEQDKEKENLDAKLVNELLSLLINITYAHDYTEQYPNLHKLVKQDKTYEYVLNHLCFYYKNGLDYTNFFDLGGNKAFEKPLYVVKEVKDFINEVNSVEDIDEYFEELKTNDDDEKNEPKFYYEEYVSGELLYKIYSWRDEQGKIDFEDTFESKVINNIWKKSKTKEDILSKVLDLSISYRNEKAVKKFFANNDEHVIFDVISNLYEYFNMSTSLCYNRVLNIIEFVSPLFNNDKLYKKFVNTVVKNNMFCSKALENITKMVQKDALVYLLCCEASFKTKDELKKQYAQTLKPFSNSNAIQKLDFKSAINELETLYNKKPILQPEPQKVEKPVVVQQPEPIIEENIKLTEEDNEIILQKEEELKEKYNGKLERKQEKSEMKMMKQTEKSEKLKAKIRAKLLRNKLKELKNKYKIEFKQLKGISPALRAVNMVETDKTKIYDALAYVVSLTLTGLIKNDECNDAFNQLHEIKDFGPWKIDTSEDLYKYFKSLESKVTDKTLYKYQKGKIMFYYGKVALSQENSTDVFPIVKEIFSELPQDYKLTSLYNESSEKLIELQKLAVKITDVNKDLEDLDISNGLPTLI